MTRQATLYEHLVVDADQVHTGYVIPVDADLDRWLAQVKAEAQVAALREAAEAFDMATINVEIFGDSEEARRWQDRIAQRKRSISSLRARADRIAREAGIETGEEQ